MSLWWTVHLSSCEDSWDRHSLHVRDHILVDQRPSQSSWRRCLWWLEVSRDVCWRDKLVINNKKGKHRYHVLQTLLNRRPSSLKTEEKQTDRGEREREREREREEEWKREGAECQAGTNCFYFKEPRCFQTDLRRKSDLKTKLVLTDNIHTCWGTGWTSTSPCPHQGQKISSHEGENQRRMTKRWWRWAEKKEKKNISQWVLCGALLPPAGRWWYCDTR